MINYHKRCQSRPDQLGKRLLDKISLDFLKETARLAGDEILDVYGTEFSVDIKEDNSPLTQADQRGNDVIVARLEAEYPDIPIISEETKATEYAERKDWEYFWLVDPLDGTKEFVKRNGEFTVNIALIHRDTPAAGVVFQPVADRMYWASQGAGAWRSVAGGEAEKLTGGPHYTDKDEITVVASRSHLTDAVQAFVDDLKAKGKSVEFLSAGSSLKLCLVAEGEADVYPRLGPTMEWDTGASHAIALEAGRKVLNHENGQPLLYNKENLLNPFFMVE